MQINITTNATETIIALEGRLDTTSAPQLEKELEGKVDNVGKLIFDLEQLQYISSAGLRVLLSVQKKINANGASMVIVHPNETVTEVFEVTGFVDILTIED